jgi:hypothetical protein
LDPNTHPNTDPPAQCLVTGDWSVIVAGMGASVHALQLAARTTSTSEGRGAGDDEPGYTVWYAKHG